MYYNRLKNPYVTSDILSSYLPNVFFFFFFFFFLLFLKIFLFPPFLPSSPSQGRFITFKQLSRYGGEEVLRVCLTSYTLDFEWLMVHFNTFYPSPHFLSQSLSHFLFSPLFLPPSPPLFPRMNSQPQLLTQSISLLMKTSPPPSLSTTPTSPFASPPSTSLPPLLPFPPLLPLIYQDKKCTQNYIFLNFVLV